MTTAWLFALKAEPWPQITWDLGFSAELLYSIFAGLLVGYWLMIWLAQQVSTITTSLILLAVPACSLVFSNFFLDEPLTISLVAALVLIIVGSVLVLNSTKD